MDRRKLLGNLVALAVVAFCIGALVEAIFDPSGTTIIPIVAALVWAAGSVVWQRSKKRVEPTGE